MNAYRSNRLAPPPLKGPAVRPANDYPGESAWVSAIVYVSGIVALASILAACGAQLSGSVGVTPGENGKEKIDLCLGILAANAPEHLSPTGIAAVKPPRTVASATPNAGPGL